MWPLSSIAPGYWFLDLPVLIAVEVRRRPFRLCLIVARRQRSNILGLCRVSGPSLLLSSQSRTTSVALHVQLKDRGVMDESINRGERHRRILKDLSPYAEGL